MQPSVVTATHYPKQLVGARSPDATHRRDLDGLRALAALSVVADHTISKTIPGGGAGVDMFFVLSGFLISGIILRELVQGKFTFSAFYSRRIRRIFPALVVVLLAVWLLGSVVLLPDEFRRLGKDIATGAAFVLYIFWGLEADLQFDVDLDMGGNVLSQLWSLGVEEQFYLLWPLFLFCIYKLSKSKLSRVTIGVAAITIASFTLLVVDNRLPRGIALVPWRGLYELSLGGLIAILKLSDFHSARALHRTTALRFILRPTGTNADIVSTVATGLLMYAVFNDPAKQLFNNSWTLAPTFGALLLVSSGSQSAIGRFAFGSSGMVFFGLISYPLYLWHFPVLIFIDALTWGHTPSPLQMFALVLPISTVLAFLTYKYIESPIRFSSRKARTVVSLSVAMILCGVLGVATFTGIIPPRSVYTKGDLALAGSEDWLVTHNASSWTPFQERPLVLGSGPPHVLFVGDSNMQQYFPRIERLLTADKLYHPAVAFMTRLGCVPGAAPAQGVDNLTSSGCRTYARDVLEYASRSNINAVVIAGCWYGYFSNFTSIDGVGKKAVLKPITAMAADRLKATMERFIQSGKHVYLVLNIPVGLGLDPRARAYWYGETPAWLSESEVRAAVEPIDSILRRIAGEVGATVIDPLNSLCHSERCPVVSADGRVLYRDAWHLRPSYVRDHAAFMDKTLSLNH